MTASRPSRIVIVGAGFTGLSAAYDLSRLGHSVTLVERDDVLGGLAAGFKVGDVYLERFYHHWFSNDRHVIDLVEELGLGANVVLRPSRTGMFYANQIFRLSRPFDLLRFTPLSLINRIRLGLLVFQARAVRDWRKLEPLTARDWLIRMCGREVFRVVWEPLLVGKFGRYADRISAVWFWKKLALRGGSRAKDGREVLAYYRGGFAALADAIGEHLRKSGVEIRTGTSVTAVQTAGDRATGVATDRGVIEADAVLITTAPRLAAELLEANAGSAPAVDAAFLSGLRRVDYLANLCLILILDRSLSDTYWLNVNDPTFPFVGVIEHTNLEPASSYAGRHIIYLSRYLPADDPIYAMSDAAVLDYALPHLQRMFPHFHREWVVGHHVWRADYAQPIAETNYSRILPARKTPLRNLLLSNMAQVYPEDRGTNYAIREGRDVAKDLHEIASTEPRR
jgi:protoporphyrinogen oxidase